MTKTNIEAHVLNSRLERRYEHSQRVSFFGGERIVRISNFEGGTWKYLGEMPHGRKPTFAARCSANGRVGAETMVLLNEKKLRAA